MAWGSLRGRLLDTTLRTFGEPDGPADHLNAAGAVLVDGLVVVIERDVDHLSGGGGLLERFVTLTVNKHALCTLDRKGSFRLSSGQVWHIDDIAADDGQQITFYVVP